jgi:hypothetical protein
MHFVCFRDEKINNLEEQMSSLKDEATRMETERTDLLAKVRYFTLIFTEVITERTDLLAKVRYFTSGIIEDLTESDKKLTIFPPHYKFWCMHFLIFF